MQPLTQPEAAISAQESLIIAYQVVFVQASVDLTPVVTQGLTAPAVFPPFALERSQRAQCSIPQQS
jgi:hypothetical protein